MPTEARGLNVPVPLGLLSDERLACLVKEGNERAFAALYGRFHQPLYRYCYSMVRHDADAQDALQSTFTSALAALQRGQRDAPLRPWLFRIAHNESISLLRRRRPADEVPETLPSAVSVEDAAEERAQLATLVADLQELPERQRGALVMRELSGLSHEDLAQALGISVGAAKQTVFEARRALAEFEEGRAMACNDIQRLISDGDRRALRGRRMRAHLRGCPSCTAFSTAIPERRAALMALTPVLPAAAASGLLSRIMGAGAAHHGGGGGLLAGATGKTVGVAVSAKTMAAGVAIVATAAVGTVGAIDVVTHSGFASNSAQAAPATHHGHGAAASHGASAAGGNAHRAGGRAHSGAGARGHHSRGHSSGSSASGGHPHPYGFGKANSSSNGSGSGSHSASRTGTGSSTHSNSGTNPNAHGGNPLSSGSNPNAHGGNPNAGGTNAGAGSSNPNAHGGNPNASGTNPNAHAGNPNANGGNSTSTTSTTTSTTHGHSQGKALGHGK